MILKVVATTLGEDRCRGGGVRLPGFPEVQERDSEVEVSFPSAVVFSTSVLA